uniref:WAP domain-containing protein n=1 Tax=Salvator merianae TaxID=96440 RepID=A0A8D0C9H9_SALMN
MRAALRGTALLLICRNNGTPFVARFPPPCGLCPSGGRPSGEGYPFFVIAPLTLCWTNCSEDNDCGGLLKCCRNGCGYITCTNPCF